MVSTNVGDEKSYSALYKEFKKRPLPAEYVEQGYQTLFARHFYTPEEIAGAVRKIAASGVSAIWPGCDVTPETPEENLAALMNSASTPLTRD